MSSIDDIIIKPSNGHVFFEKQGDLFLPLTYKYASSDGLKLRSKEECYWHYILSKKGILHTYEPRIPRAHKRPDFGIANNFLIEICGMVKSPFFEKYENKKRREYKELMNEKRRIFLDLGYNVFEVYAKGLVLNSNIIRTEKKIPFVLSVIMKYSTDYACPPAIVHFRQI